jgi:hypothetical protein
MGDAPRVAEVRRQFIGRVPPEERTEDGVFAVLQMASLLSQKQVN